MAQDSCTLPRLVLQKPAWLPQPPPWHKWSIHSCAFPHPRVSGLHPNFQSKQQRNPLAAELCQTVGLGSKSLPQPCLCWMAEQEVLHWLHTSAVIQSLQMSGDKSALLCAGEAVGQLQSSIGGGAISSVISRCGKNNGLE